MGDKNIMICLEPFNVHLDYFMLLDALREKQQELFDKGVTSRVIIIIDENCYYLINKYIEYKSHLVEYQLTELKRSKGYESYNAVAIIEFLQKHYPSFDYYRVEFKDFNENGSSPNGKILQDAIGSIECTAHTVNRQIAVMMSDYSGKISEHMHSYLYYGGYSRCPCCCDDDDDCYVPPITIKDSVKAIITEAYTLFPTPTPFLPEHIKL